MPLMWLIETLHTIDKVQFIRLPPYICVSDIAVLLDLGASPHWFATHKINLVQTKLEYVKVQMSRTLRLVLHQNLISLVGMYMSSAVYI
jgi:hypothetical protein